MYMSGRLAAVLLGWSLSCVPAQASSLVVGGGALAKQSGGAVGVAQFAVEQTPISELMGIQLYSGALLAEQDSWYLHGGLAKTFELPGRWSWGAGLSAGVYHSNHPELDLGYDIEFMSRVYLEYEFSLQHAVRLEAGHLSNANLGDENPGTEFLLLNWVYRL